MGNETESPILKNLNIWQAQYTFLKEIDDGGKW